MESAENAGKIIGVLGGLWAAAKKGFVHTLRAGNLEDALRGQISKDALKFVEEVKDVENEVFGRYQNFYLVPLHGESAQMVVSAILQHLREVLVRERLTVTVIRKMINITDLSASSIAVYYITLLMRFEQILIDHPSDLGSQFEALVAFMEELLEVRRLIIENQANITCRDKSTVIKALQAICEELSYHIEKVKFIRELTSIGEELKNLDTNMRQVHTHLIMVVQYAASPHTHFKAVSSLGAARKYPWALTLNTLASLTDLMSTNFGPLLLSMSSYEIYPFHSRAANVHTLDLSSAEFVAPNPKSLVCYQNRIEIFETIKELHALQNVVGIFIQSNQAMTSSVFAIGEVIIANNKMLKEMIIDHLKLGDIVFQKSLSLCEKIMALLGSGGEEVNPDVLTLTIEAIAHNMRAIQQFHERFDNLFERITLKLRQYQHPGYVRHMLLHFVEIGLQEARVLAKELPGYDHHKLTRLATCRELVYASDLGSLLGVNDDGMVTVRRPKVTAISIDDFLEGRSELADHATPVSSIAVDDVDSAIVSGTSFRYDETVEALKKAQLRLILLNDNQKNVLKMINSAISPTSKGKKRNSAISPTSKGKKRNAEVKKALGDFIRSLEVDGKQSFTNLRDFEKKHFDFLSSEQLWGLLIRLLNICFISSEDIKVEYYRNVATALACHFKVTQAGSIDEYRIPEISVKAEFAVDFLPFNPIESFAITLSKVSEYTPNSISEKQLACVASEDALSDVVPGSKVQAATAGAGVGSVRDTFAIPASADPPDVKRVFSGAPAFFAQPIEDRRGSANEQIIGGDLSGWSLLAFAVYNNQVEIANDLLAKGADRAKPIEKGDWKGWSLLAYAVRNNYIEIARCLLDAGANPNDVMKNGILWGGWSLLDFAVRDNRVELAAALLAKNTDPNKLIEKGDWKGWSLLAYAVRDGRVEIARALLENLADPDQLIQKGDWKGWSLLAYAVYNNQLGIANALITAGANANVVFPNGLSSQCSIREYIHKKHLAIDVPILVDQEPVVQEAEELNNLAGRLRM